MTCRTFVIASVNRKHIQRTCWHLGTYSKNPVPVVSCLFLPIFLTACLDFSNQFSWHNQAALWGSCLPLDATQPPLCLPGTGFTDWLPSQPRGAWTSVQIHQYRPTPPRRADQNILFFLSHTRWQFDRCIGHFSFRKPRDMALGFKPWCPCAQSGCPWAAVPENSTHAEPRGMCRGYQVLCYFHSAPPELRQGDCFLTHSCTHKLRTQFCPLTQTPISQSIQRGRLHRWATGEDSVFGRPTSGTARETSVPCLASFFLFLQS